jgi:hypothetical protein
MSQLRTNSIVPLDGIPSGASGGGIIQVVTTTKTDVFSATLANAGASTNGITGFQALITPRSTSSKILVMVSLQTTITAGASDNNTVRAVLKRGATEICIGDADGSRKRATVGGNGYLGTGNAVFAPLNFQFLDNPNTTTEITYSVDLSHTSTASQTVFVNRTGSDTNNSSYTRSTSTITLMEVSG